jgi:hypothetical protein
VKVNPACGKLNNCGDIFPAGRVIKNGLPNILLMLKILRKKSEEKRKWETKE